MITGWRSVGSTPKGQLTSSFEKNNSPWQKVTFLSRRPSTYDKNLTKAAQATDLFDFFGSQPDVVILLGQALGRHRPGSQLS